MEPSWNTGGGFQDWSLTLAGGGARTVCGGVRDASDIRDTHGRNIG